MKRINLIIEESAGILRSLANSGIRVFLMAFAISLVAVSCGDDDDNADPNAPAITAFSFLGQQGASVINHKEHTVQATAECGTNIAALTPEFTLTPEGATAKVNGALQTSGVTTVPFSEPVTYVVTTADGKTSAEWTVTVKLPEGCPQGGTDPQGELKAATIHYRDSRGNDQYLCFDSNGRQRRWEGINQDGSHVIFICDEINGKYHMWSNDPDGPGWAPDQIITAADVKATTSIYLIMSGTYAHLNYYSMIPGASKKTETIAGQSCDVYRIPGDDVTAVTGVWENTVVLRISGDDTGLEAVSAKRGCPANAFTKTVEINWN